MKQIVKTIGPLAAAVTNSIALTQTPTAAFTLNGALVAGGIATIAAPSRITVTTAANETGKNITVVGTDASGNVISEVIAGPNIATATSVLTYKTVTSITISSAAAGAITVGNSQSGSITLALDTWALPMVGLQVSVSGTVNYSVQSTFDNPNDPANPVAPSALQWLDSSDAAVVNATATKQSNFAYAPPLVRLVLNSGAGSARISIIQYGVVPA